MDKYFKINLENISYRMIDGEIVILNLKTGDYYLLEKTGVFIWKLLEQKISLKKLIERFSNEYALNLKKANQDIRPLLKDLLKENLILSV